MQISYLRIFGEPGTNIDVRACCILANEDVLASINLMVERQRPTIPIYVA